MESRGGLGEPVTTSMATEKLSKSSLTVHTTGDNGQYARVAVLRGVQTDLISD